MDRGWVSRSGRNNAGPNVASGAATASTAAGTGHIFLLDDIKTHLDEDPRGRGNYVRNTMSQREAKELKPHKLLPDGKFDLDQWNEEYWQRFQNMLQWTAERDIIVQIEVWDRFDFSRENWDASPWNPVNNVNYTSEQTGFAEKYPSHPGADLQPFFHSIPGMPRYDGARSDLIRQHQEAFVNKMLSYSLPYGHVLYCMNNETTTPVAWGQYWMKFIQAAAQKQGVTVFCTDMFDDVWTPQKSAMLRQAFDDPHMYPFLDVSQVNSRNYDDEHWENVLWIAQQREAHPRPLNNTKICGSGYKGHGTGGPEDGIERFWRDILGGAASARFHRADSGNGLNDRAKASIQAARLLEQQIKFWEITPHMELLPTQRSIGPALTLGVILLGLSISGSLALSSPFPVRVSDNGRHLVDARGKPFLLHGDTAWSLIVQLTKEETEEYLENRRQKGFNAILVNLIEKFYADNPPKNKYGDAPFTTPGDFSTPNEAYFAHADWVIQKANEKGILVVLNPCYTGYSGNGTSSRDGWIQETIANGPTKCRNYGRYIGNRYKKFPNIIWQAVGDSTLPAGGAGEKNWLEILQGIKEVAPSHHWTAHYRRGTAALDVAAFAPHMTLDNTYSSNRTYIQTLKAYNRTNHKPSFVNEAYYEDTQFGGGAVGTPPMLRAQAYWALLSGASGHIFGSDHVWMFGGPGGTPGNPWPRLDWRQGMDRQGSREMVHVKKLFEGRAWHELVPDRICLPGHANPAG